MGGNRAVPRREPATSFLPPISNNLRSASAVDSAHNSSSYPLNNVPGSDLDKLDSEINNNSSSAMNGGDEEDHITTEMRLEDVEEDEDDVSEL